MHRRKQTSNIDKILILLKKNIMLYEFDTIKHIKNFEKYVVWYERTYYVIFEKKYGTLLFVTVWFEFFENSIESLYMRTQKKSVFGNP